MPNFADEVHGGLTGIEKGPALRASRAIAYVGDHVLDMEGASAAGVIGVGVTSGSHGAHELVAAGAKVVLSSLEMFNEAFLNELISQTDGLRGWP